MKRKETPFEMVLRLTADLAAAEKAPANGFEPAVVLSRAQFKEIADRVHTAEDERTALRALILDALSWLGERDVLTLRDILLTALKRLDGRDEDEDQDGPNGDPDGAA